MAKPCTCTCACACGRTVTAAEQQPNEHAVGTLNPKQRQNSSLTIMLSEIQPRLTVLEQVQAEHILRVRHCVLSRQAIGKTLNPRP